jgi:crotonobetainyl-CoA:carnitine CoA-transferase CaiB-like acyl-CoA transferase
MNTPQYGLEGIKVLDLTRVLAGPLCTMMLGDLGARVLKVERPGSGDETRGWGPPFAEDGSAAYFLSVNRNKRSIAADLRQPADRELLRGLMLEADVVVENFLPGVLERYGIDSESMLAENRDLVWCTIGGFSEDPDRPGYDLVVQAESGWMSVNGEPGGVPLKAPVAVVDVLTGKDAAIAILARLQGRARLSAADRHVRVYLDRSAGAALVNVAQNVLVTGRPARRWGNGHANLVPYQPFATATTQIIVAVGSDAQWRALATVLSDDRISVQAVWSTNAGRVTDREACVTAVADVLARRPADVWLAALSDAGVPCGAVRTVDEAVRGTAADAHTGMPSSVAGAVFTPPPQLGADTARVRTRGWGVFDEPDSR